MINIERLYDEKENIKELINGAEPKELIESLKQYYKNIRIIPDQKDEESLKGRKRYLGERTTNLLVSLTENIDKKYIGEVIQLIAEQDFWVHHNLCEKINLFEYLINHLNIIKEMNTLESLILVAYTLRGNAKQVYGKEVCSSNGNRGYQYKGFLNDLFSKEYFSPEEGLGIHFRLMVSLRSHDILEIARSFGVNEETIMRLKIKSENTTFLNECVPNRFVSNHYAEEAFEEAFEKFVEELNNAFQQDYPEHKVDYYKMFSERTDVETDYYVTIEKTVQFHNNYHELKSQLIKTIKTFNTIDENYFGYRHMAKDIAEIKKESRESHPNLFMPLFN